MQRRFLIPDRQYEELLHKALTQGAIKKDRTKTGTRSIFGHQMRYDLRKGFPLVTTKKVHFKSVVTELLWFLRGDTNTAFLKEHGCTIWDEWADANGDLGPVYGKQWRSWPTPDGGSIDQIAKVVDQLTNNPDSRRIIVSAWNVGQLDEMALEPCHAFFQFYTTELTHAEREQYTSSWMGSMPDGDNTFSKEFLDELDTPTRRLSCQLYQRSADIFLGVPFNIASYALLTHMLAQQTNMLVGDFVWTGGDCHLYENHVEQAKLQLTREPYYFPRLAIKQCPKTIFDYDHEVFGVMGYKHHDPIKAPVAV